MAEDEKEPVLKIGGDASGAESALRSVRAALNQTASAAKSAGNTIRESFGGGILSTLSKLGNVITGLYSSLRLVGMGLDLVKGALGLVKQGVFEVAGVLKQSYLAWDKEAKAQVRIDYLLRANAKNYRAASKELDRMNERTQRLTNFGSSDVRGVVGAFMQTGGNRGFFTAQKMLPSILDLSAARGYDPETLAESFARAIATGTTMMLRRQGIVVNEAAFKRDPTGTLQSYVSRIAPGAAQAEREAAPLTSLIHGLEGIMNKLGKALVDPFVRGPLEILSRAAHNASAALDKMKPMEVWDSILKYGYAAWQLIAAAGVTAWNYLKSPAVLDAVSAAIKTGIDTTLATIKGFFNSEFAKTVGKAIADAIGVSKITNPINTFGAATGIGASNIWDWLKKVFPQENAQGMFYNPSKANQPASSRSWWDKIFGVQSAAADEVSKITPLSGKPTSWRPVKVKPVKGAGGTPADRAGQAVVAMAANSGIPVPAPVQAAVATYAQTYASIYGRDISTNSLVAGFSKSAESSDEREHTLSEWLHRPSGTRIPTQMGNIERENMQVMHLFNTALRNIDGRAADRRRGALLPAY